MVIWLVILCSIITICTPWTLPDDRGRLRRHNKNIPRFYEQTPSRKAFKLPSHIQSKYKASASGGAGMYGIAGPSYVDGYGTLVKYDTVSGNTTTIQVTNGNPLTGESLGCLDNINKVFFFIYEELNRETNEIIAGLYPYNLADETVAYDPIILHSIYADEVVGAGDECTSDPNTGDIYVFGHDANNVLYQLLLRVQFSAAHNNATIEQIGNYSSIDDIPLIAGEITIYDSKRNMLWLAGEDGDDSSNFTIDYFYIDAKTGTIVNTINFEKVPIDTALYNPKLDLIVGLTTAGRDVKGYFSFEMVYADAQTLEIIKPFSPFSNNWCAWEAIYSMDVDGGVYYGIIYKLPEDAACETYNGTFLGHLVGVDVTKGTVMDEPEFCKFGEILSCPWELQYWDDK